MWFSWVSFRRVWGPEGDWVGEHEKDVLDGILQRGGLTVVTLSAVKGKCDYLECVSGGCGAMSGTPGS